MRYDRARAKHQALIVAEEHPASPKFDEVLELLGQVPESSPRYAQAQRLRDGILGARGHLRAPLATVPNADGGLSPRVVAQLRACAHLVELLGRDGGVSPAGLQTLADCRQRAERLDVKDEHAEDPP